MRHKCLICDSFTGCISTTFPDETQVFAFNSKEWHPTGWKCLPTSFKNQEQCEWQVLTHGGLEWTGLAEESVSSLLPEDDVAHGQFGQDRFIPVFPVET